MNKIQKSYYALGTIINLTLFGNPETYMLENTNRLIKYYEDLFTVNSTTSEVMSINQAAGVKPVSVSDATYNIVKKSIILSQENFGFNSLIGPLVKLWRIGFGDAQVPTKAQIQKYLTLIDPQAATFNDEDQSIYLKNPAMELDLGAIAKGYIADRIKDYWSAWGKQAGIIDLGGNILFMGASPLHQDHLWSIGIRDPQNPSGKPIAAVRFKACSAGTSGIYERHLDSGSKSYHHILDPQTGYPHDNNLASVTVLSKLSFDGEVETTRLFFADQPIADWGNNSSDLYGAIFVTLDKKIILQKLPPQAITLLDDQYELITF
ncbi:FAD:protein FMN transferase [Xylocopilactobacillus apicola]|uniref:FAD:protein FMN transferase n=1 Tax=Xylocopilactobacillus apicola TaxID=2932184 RepID=A0AAU9DGT3_9LACO|nr:FAD:protein FMN transferase [Xylocopilactobacillus apicola]BDR59175.1 FAD:protein FMN transferase [Xylocopilactobacillus apicola]